MSCRFVFAASEFIYRGHAFLSNVFQLPACLCQLVVVFTAARPMVSWDCVVDI